MPCHILLRFHDRTAARMREYYTITELTREFDISTRTLRFYEDEGLIAPVRRGRTRLFRPSDRHLGASLRDAELSRQDARRDDTRP